ncbi:MAG: Glycerol kinase (EC [uncultured Caballeronia sp.]|nr:MAG: Glycerol kinase (EC [uncultured Caballeronia sp.]
MQEAAAIHLKKPVKKTMQEQYILALDQGTTSSRAMVFDPQGNVVSVHRRNFARSIRSRAGSSTTRRKSGQPRPTSPPKPSPAQV